MIVDQLTKRKPAGSFRFVVATMWLDIVGFVGTFYLSWLLRIGIWGDGNWIAYAAACAIGLAIYLFLNFGDEAYTVNKLRSSFDSVYLSSKNLLLTFGVLLLCAFALKITSDYSRLWGFGWALMLLMYTASTRLFVSRVYRRMAASGRTATNAVIVGVGTRGAAASDLLLKHAADRFHVLGFVDAGDLDVPTTDRSQPVVGALHDIGRIVAELEVEQVFVAFDDAMDYSLQSVLSLLSQWAVQVYVVTDVNASQIGSGGIESFGALTCRIAAERPIDKWAAFVKRCEDIFCCIIGFATLWPIFLLAAAAIKLESQGPLLFVQERRGFNGKIIPVYKFRSMYAHSTDHHATLQTTVNDPRVTKVGKFIRKTSIDELPQLFNVMKGQMSIVGPRPHALETKAGGKLFEDVVDNYAARHRVKPGLTGWAQVNGWRGETDTEEKLQRRVEHDLYYINNWSVFLDLFIIAKTVFVLLARNENAY